MRDFYLQTTSYQLSIERLSALEDDIPITDPNFYSSETLCPDSLIEHIFRPAGQSTEKIPLLQERISVMREVGFILCNVRIGVVLGEKFLMLCLVEL